MKLRRRRRGAAKAKRLPRGETIITWSLRLPESLDAAVRSRAQRDRRSANNMVVTLLADALANDLARLADESGVEADDAR